MGINISTMCNESDKYIMESEFMTSIVEGEVILKNPIIQSPITDIQNIKKNLIDKLPQDIVNKIYKDYLEPELYYLQYKNIIETIESKLLNGIFIIPFIPIILAKPIACKYISTKCKAFNYSYIKHKIKKTKIFSLMTKGHSFAACILFTLYH